MALLLHIDRLRGLADDTVPSVPDFNYPVLGWDLPLTNTVVNLSQLLYRIIYNFLFPWQSTLTLSPHEIRYFQNQQYLKYSTSLLRIYPQAIT